MQRPVDHPDLWWNLARGREVCAGSLSPSQQLLALDDAHEADWLGGVPFYLVWQFGGVHMLAAIPILAGCSALLFVRRLATGHGLLLVLTFPPGLWTLRDALQPSPQLFDLAGLVVVGWLLSRKRPTTSEQPHPRLLPLVLLFAVWANLAPLPVWGLLAIALLASPERFHPGQLVAALIGGVLTPRGLWTWTDSIVSLAPVAFRDLTSYDDVRWRPLFDADLHAGHFAFFALWIAWVVLRIVARRLPKSEPRLLLIARFGLPLLAVIISRNNLPLSGLWILLDLAGSPPFTDSPPKRVPLPTGARASLLLFAAAALLLVLAAFEAVQTTGARLGWGIAHSLDIRLLDSGLPRANLGQLTAWPADARSAGFGAWLGLRIVDHPARALLAGRSPQHAGLMQDFLYAHRARYRRDDGSWGGWVHRLSEWKVDLLLLPAEAASLQRSLVETPWKPVDLDSPVVPCASGEDLRFASSILGSLQQQAFVEAGPWQPDAAIYDGHGWRFDLIELAGLGPDPAPAIRQSQLFRSIKLPMASLRALRPLRGKTTAPALTEEFRTVQSELVAWEWLEAGEASLFREWILVTLDGNTSEDRQSSESIPAVWRRSIDQYLAGRFDDAINSLPADDPPGHYAAGLIWLELGETARALEAFRQVDTRDAGPLHILSEAWIQQIVPFER